MSALLDAIAAERETLLAPIAGRLAVLDELERLAASLNGTTTRTEVTVTVPARALPDARAIGAALRQAGKAPEGRGKPRQAPAAPRVGRDGLGPKASRILEALRANQGWMSTTEVAAVGGDFTNKVMQSLVTRGLAEARGETVQRRYRATQEDDARATGPGPGTETIRPAAPAPPSTRATAAVPKLNAAATRILRARIVDHLGRRRLNAQSLADHLNAELAHVTPLVSELLGSGEIVQDDDGLYREAA